MIEIDAGVRIDESELEFLFSRSGGPGGQNVNKVSTRVTLRFALDASPSLTEVQKDRIRRAHSSRITTEGVLFLHAQRFRSQEKNREDAVVRFAALLRSALTPRAKRIPTAPSNASRERRLTEKGRRSSVKQGRSRPAPEE